MLKALETLGKNASITIIFGLAFGLLLQPLAAQSKPLLLPAVWSLLTFSMCRLDFNNFIIFLKKKATLAVLVIWLLIICPILMWFTVSNIPVSEGTLFAIIMTAGSSPLIGAAAIGRLLRLNSEIILGLLISTTILVPITLPFIAIEFLGIELGLNTTELFLRLSLLIGSAGFAASIIRHVGTKFQTRMSEQSLDGITVLLLWACGVPLMDGVLEHLLMDPKNTLLIILISFSVYIGLMIIGTIFAFMMWRDWSSAMSVGLACGCRNLAVIIVVLPSDIDQQVTLYFALAQFPIYLMPMVLSFIGSRILNK